MASNLSGVSEKQSSLGLVDQLFGFFFKSRKQQYIVYAVAFSIAFSFAIVSDLVLGRPQHEVVVESVVLASVLLISLPLAYVFGRIRREERTSIKLPSGSPAWVPAVGEPSFAFASAISQAYVRELTNALKTIQSNEERQRQTQDFIATAISRIDAAQHQMPSAIQALGSTIGKGQATQLQELFDAIGKHLRETIAEGLSVTFEQHNAHLVAMLSQAIEQQNQEFVRILSQVLEQQTGSFSTLLERLGQVPESSERDRFRARIRERQDFRRSGTLQSGAIEFRRPTPKRYIKIYDAEGNAFYYAQGLEIDGIVSAAEPTRIVPGDRLIYFGRRKEEKAVPDTPELEVPDSSPQNVK